MVICPKCKSVCEKIGEDEYIPSNSEETVRQFQKLDNIIATQSGQIVRQEQQITELIETVKTLAEKVG
jgi:hypothetical protein